MYDFIIFEHSGIRNHFVDLCAIGHMLRDSGFHVAIANVTSEAKECAEAGLPILELQAHPNTYKSKTAYMKAVIEELSPKTKYLYAGSILSSTSLTWLRYVPKYQKIFLWALRSFFFVFYKRFHISRSCPGDVLRSFRNAAITSKLTNVRFFVSDPIIRNEFIALGYAPWRLIIRPERTTTVFRPIKTTHNDPLSLLAIGALREEKRVDLCIEALNTLKDSGLHFTIAGKAYAIHGYDRKLERLSYNNPYITRISNRLSDDEYKNLISNCDYLVLCDEKQPSCVTNGTMAEALLAGRPIIAPNYNPYKYIVEKYKVGLLYEMYNQDSLVSTLKQAKYTNPSVFADGIIQYQKDFMYDAVLSDFAASIYETLKQ